MRECVSAGFSIPREILLKIDRLRGDVSRSKFLLRLVEKALEDKGMTR
jgi:hypothetical protein